MTAPANPMSISTGGRFAGRLILHIFLLLMLFPANNRVLGMSVTATAISPPPILADRTCMISITWQGAKSDRWTADPVEMRIIQPGNGILFKCTHDVPFDSFQTTETDWNITYTIPVKLPPVSTPVILSITIIKNADIFESAGQIEMIPNTRAPELVTGPSTELGPGWFDLETDPVSGEAWRWMSRESLLTLQNPFRPCELVLVGAVPQDKFQQPAGLHVSINGHEIDCTVPSSGVQTFRYELPVFLLGENPVITLGLKVDSCFRPSDDGTSTDTRTLGFKLMTLYFR